MTTLKKIMDITAITLFGFLMLATLGSCQAPKMELQSPKTSPSIYFDVTKGSEPELTFGNTLSRTLSLAKAISLCEGYGKKGTIATRLNNPGNLKAGPPHDKFGHTRYQTPLQGWSALYSLLLKHEGENVKQMSRWYAQSSNQWQKCVQSKM